MINIYELRKGSIVVDKNLPTLNSVIWGFDENDVIQTNYNDNIQSEDISPIPLTPEILEKCEYDKKVFWIKEYMHTDGYDMAINGNWLGVQLKYLHQLQNLYFALTGTELLINL